MFIFADIAKFTDFPDEQEVPSDLGALFKVEKVCPNNEMWRIYFRVIQSCLQILTETIGCCRIRLSAHCRNRSDPLHERNWIT